MDSISLADMLRRGPVPPPVASAGEQTEQLAEESVISFDDPFSEEPVSLEVFMSDTKFLGNPPLGPVQYQAVRHAERVYFPETYNLLAENASDLNSRQYWSEPCRMTNLITLQIGKGGGKDHICRVAVLRVCYLLLCLRNPQSYFSMAPQDTIHLLNVASTRPQAREAFFTPMARAVRRGWFKELAIATRNEVQFAKNVTAISGSSDVETQEGLNLIVGVADEVDAFRSREEVMRHVANRDKEPVRSAEGILKMLKTSASTRFPTTYKNIRISYPRYKGSMIQQLTKEAHDDIAARGEENSRHYVVGPIPTWEVNPRLFNVPREIPMKDGKALSKVPVPLPFVPDYESDPATARTMYECLPERAVTPYFRNTDAVEAAFTLKQDPVIVDYRLVETMTTSGKTRQVWVPDYTIDPALVPMIGALYSVHADLAITGDRAGVAVTHIQKFVGYQAIGEDDEGMPVPVWEHRPFVKADFVISYSADNSVLPPREIQIRWVRQLVLELRRRGFVIGSVTYDGFQSTDSMQILEQEHGIESGYVSADRSEEPYKTLRDLIYEGRLSVPQNALLLDEIKNLQRQPNGKIDHMPGGSKDLSDALACSAVGAIILGGQESDEPDFPSRSHHVEVIESSFSERLLGMPELMKKLAFDGGLLDAAVSDDWGW